MDIFTLDQYGTQGKLVNGFKNMIWTERYRAAGDFKLSAAYNPKLMELLPLGSYISHFDTREMMEVQDHEILKKRGKPPTLAITGRSFETFLECRVAAPNTGGFRNRSGDTANVFNLGKANSWHQAAVLIERHLTGSDVGIMWSGDTVPYFNVVETVPGNEDPKLGRIFERGNVYERVLELLGISDCGIKSRRPGVDSSTIDLIIHKGVDRSETAVISAKMDELDEVGYFFSNRKHRNWAFVCGKYTGRVVRPTADTGVNRRWVYVDASDIEEETSDDNETYIEQLIARGTQALATNKLVEITNPVISPTNTLLYGRDYDVGDTVGITGDFNVSTKMRVDEYTWSFDQTGVFGYPTLTPIN